MMLDRGQRSFFWLLVRRDLKVRYAGSTLGGLWNLIHPLMMIAIYMTIFSTLMRDRPGSGGTSLVNYGALNYGVHLVAGLIPWLLFSDVLIRSTGVLIENGNLLQKVAFPPIILFGPVLLNAFLVQGAGMLILFVLLLATGQPVPIEALCSLGVMALMGVSAVGLGLILAGLNVFFRDTAQILQIVMQVLFWFNPVVYYKDIIFGKEAAPDGLLHQLTTLGRVILMLNPFERFITASQSLFGAVHDNPTALDWAIVVIFPWLCLALGVWLFRRMLPDVRDCL
ncbi:ABC transporter permease [bacterium]|nr:ABC transporter permease [bacterium]